MRAQLRLVLLPHIVCPRPCTARSHHKQHLPSSPLCTHLQACGAAPPAARKSMCTAVVQSISMPHRPSQAAAEPEAQLAWGVSAHRPLFVLGGGELLLLGLPQGVAKARTGRSSTPAQRAATCAARLLRPSVAQLALLYGHLWLGACPAERNAAHVPANQQQPCSTTPVTRLVSRTWLVNCSQHQHPGFA